MIKLFGYEISIGRETDHWYNENMTQKWAFFLLVERLTPQEKAHRKMLQETQKRPSKPL